jgi:hypothetical protein
VCIEAECLLGVKASDRQRPLADRGCGDDMRISEVLDLFGCVDFVENPIIMVQGPSRVIDPRVGSQSTAETTRATLSICRISESRSRLQRQVGNI